MKINEIEALLGISKANIRFYEKEGLLNPKRSENGYRVYNEADVECLKKVIIFRKMGMAIPEIKKVFDGEIPLKEALSNNREQLEKQLEELNGAIGLCKTMEKDQTAAESFDVNRYWQLIQEKTAKGEKFAALLDDYLEYQKKSVSALWAGPFLLPINKIVKKHGWKITLCILFFICILRGLFGEIFGFRSFLEGFGYPFVLFMIIEIITLPLFLINQKYKDVEIEEEPERLVKGVMAVVKVIAWVAYLPVIFLGGIVFSSYLTELILDDWIGDVPYVTNYTFFIPFFIVCMYLFCVTLWLYSKRGVFGQFPEEGIKAHLPKKVKKTVMIYSLLAYFFTFLVCTVCFDCVTQDGAMKVFFFYRKDYTWDDVAYYKISDNFDDTLKFTIVMKDGTKVDCLGGSGEGDTNLPQEQYPDDAESFCLEITRILKEKGIEARVDFDKLDKELGYEYWRDYAGQLRKIIEE